MCEERTNGVREEKLGHICNIDKEKKKGLAMKK